ncbi:hypothetical protein QAD02_008434 [Eretmocerus hayati]|uniref:Uncharacterized protein n=1 Tax=Eretmocerus hayati TaxID=131215 RepID=A0ACC2N6S0_9HYME|nr:hypothetical protein QAD02_008434 [Eretmocerus hayati]
MNKSVNLYGVTEDKISSLGTVWIKFSIFKVKFHVLEDNFPIPHHDIFGARFSSGTDSVIDFGTDTTQIHDQKLRFKKGSMSSNNVHEIEIPTDENALLYVDIANFRLEVTEQYLVDAGSEGNVIKRKYVDQCSPIDTQRTVRLKDTGNDLFMTIGAVTLRIFDMLVEFQVVPDDLPIPAEGILGSAFLTQTKAIIKFKQKILQIGTKRVSVID